MELEEAVGKLRAAEAKREAIRTMQQGAARYLNGFGSGPGEIEWLIGIHERCAHMLMRVQRDVEEARQDVDMAHAK